MGYKCNISDQCLKKQSLWDLYSSDITKILTGNKKMMKNRGKIRRRLVQAFTVILL